MNYSLKTLLMYLSFNCSNKFKTRAKESLPKTRDIYSAVSVMTKKKAIIKMRQIPGMVVLKL